MELKQVTMDHLIALFGVALLLLWYAAVSHLSECNLYVAVHHLLHTNPPKLTHTPHMHSSAAEFKIPDMQPVCLIWKIWK